MIDPQNPEGFDINQFSPPTTYREADIGSIADAVAGPEPQAKIAYQFGRRVFVELQPYDDE